jgi:hypothetical protein
MTALVKKEMPTGDGFSGWEDGVEGRERPEGAGLIQGTLLKFTNDSTWVTRDDEEIPSDLELVACDVARVTQKWCDGQPIETRILEPGEKFPDVEAMNAEIPREQWEEGPTGEPRPPWQNQCVLYLVDLATMEKYTFPSGTVGGKIAIGELRDKLVWMRRVRGLSVYAVILLRDKFMKTKFGGRQRPHFQIVRWVKLGTEGGGEELSSPVQQLAAPDSTLPEVQAPSLAEDLNDDLPDDLAPPKPVKAKKAKA